MSRTKNPSDIYRQLNIRCFVRAWVIDSGKELQWRTFCRHGVHAYERLQTQAPKKARPHCCFVNTVVFYDDNMKEISRCSHYDFQGAFRRDNDVLLFPNGVWYEYTGGGVVWRNGAWYFEHTAFKNRDMAIMMNQGFPFYRRESEPSKQWYAAINFKHYSHRAKRRKKK